MEHKVIAITGANRGIGIKIAEEFLADEVTVVCLNRSGRLPDGFPSAQSDRSAHSAKFLAIDCDVKNESSVKQAFERIEHEFGRLDVLINNAGIHKEIRSSEMPVDLWDDIMDTNARGVILTCLQAYSLLCQREKSLIVNIGSFFEKLGVKHNVAYCASKAAVGAITRCLAVEWAKKGIQVVNIAPGYIVTDINQDALGGPLKTYLEKRIPASQPGTTQDISRLIRCLVTNEIGFLTGETIFVDGGQSIAH